MLLNELKNRNKVGRIDMHEDRTPSLEVNYCPNIFSLMGFYLQLQEVIKMLIMLTIMIILRPGNLKIFILYQ